MQKLFISEKSVALNDRAVSDNVSIRVGALDRLVHYSPIASGFGFARLVWKGASVIHYFAVFVLGTASGAQLACASAFDLISARLFDRRFVDGFSDRFAGEAAYDDANRCRNNQPEHWKTSQNMLLKKHQPGILPLIYCFTRHHKHIGINSTY